MNIKKCTNVSGRALHLCKKAHCGKPYCIWLTPSMGKMSEILRCDWLPERIRWCYLARSGLPGPLYPARTFSRKSCIKSFTSQVWSVKMAGCWLCSFRASLWTCTPWLSDKDAIKHLIIKITITSTVIGLKNSYFPLIHLPSCYRTVCYWPLCYWTVCYRTVQ